MNEVTGDSWVQWARVRSLACGFDGYTPGLCFLMVVTVLFGVAVGGPLGCGIICCALLPLAGIGSRCSMNLDHRAREEELERRLVGRDVTGCAVRPDIEALRAAERRLIADIDGEVTVPVKSPPESF